MGIQMKDSLEKQLVEKYPSLFRDYNKPASETLICFGCDCNDGWYDILDELFKKISKYPDVSLFQVKEKFGGLRVYLNGGPPEVYDFIREAEEKSYKTCEKCGKDGKLREDLGWILTLCETCYEYVKEGGHTN